jgi:hypothetical protein
MSARGLRASTSGRKPGWKRQAHICTGTGLPPSTSAPRRHKARLVQAAADALEQLKADAAAERERDAAQAAARMAAAQAEHEAALGRARQAAEAELEEQLQHAEAHAHEIERIVQQKLVPLPAHACPRGPIGAPDLTWPHEWVRPSAC